jgi:hypothetical protein
VGRRNGRRPGVVAGDDGDGRVVRRGRAVSVDFLHAPIVLRSPLFVMNRPRAARAADLVARVLDRMPRLRVVRASAAAAPPDHARRDEVPTLQQLVVSGELGTVKSTTSHPLFIAPFPCHIRQASLVTWYGNVPASNRRFWTVKLWRVRAGKTADIAVKTTKETGGHGIRARHAWPFDAAHFGPAGTLDKGDAVAFAFYRTGAAPPLRRVAGMVRYVPR